MTIIDINASAARVIAHPDNALLLHRAQSPARPRGQSIQQRHASLARGLDIIASQSLGMGDSHRAQSIACRIGRQSLASCQY